MILDLFQILLIIKRISIRCLWVDKLDKVLLVLQSDGVNCDVTVPIDKSFTALRAMRNAARKSFLAIVNHRSILARLNSSVS